MFIDNFVPSIDETELKEGTMKMVTVSGKHILLARTGKTRRLCCYLPLSRLEI